MYRNAITQGFSVWGGGVGRVGRLPDWITPKLVTLRATLGTPGELYAPRCVEAVLGAYFPPGTDRFWSVSVLLPVGASPTGSLLASMAVVFFPSFKPTEPPVVQGDCQDDPV